MTKISRTESGFLAFFIKHSYWLAIFFFGFSCGMGAGFVYQQTGLPKELVLAVAAALALTGVKAIRT